MNEHKICRLCGEGKLNDLVESRALEHSGKSGTYLFSHSMCDFCGSDQIDAAQSKLNKRAVIALKKELDGFITGSELKALRARWGITQAQATQIFGGGPVAFSKYENDEVVQAESMNRLLKVAAEVPEAFNFLCKAAGVETNSTSARYAQGKEQNELIASFFCKTVIKTYKHTVLTDELAVKYSDYNFRIISRHHSQIMSEGLLSDSGSPMGEDEADSGWFTPVKGSTPCNGVVLTPSVPQWKERAA